MKHGGFWSVIGDYFAMQNSRLLKAVGIALITTFTAVPDVSGQLIPGYPDLIESFDAREIALLPKYCKYTQTYREHVPGGSDPAQIAHWYELLGPAFNSMHHYCNGLMKTNRALLLATTKQVRQFYLGDSIQEFDYVIRTTPRDFVMLPEIYTKRGENLLQLQRLGLGIDSLQQAIDLKPDYWPPYAAASDYFRRKGDLAKAREWLQQGLVSSPNAQPLHKRLAELDSGATKRSR